MGTEIGVRIGEVLPNEALGATLNAKQLAARLREVTYAT
jgi:hypothetical protein